MLSMFSSCPLHVLCLRLQVCCECCCAEAVFPLAVSLLDRFLSASLAPPLAPPLLLAAACILIASKLTESNSVAADTLCANAEYDFLPADLRVSGEGREVLDPGGGGAGGEGGADLLG